MPATPDSASASGCVRLVMRPRRLTVGGPRGGSVLRWTAAARTAVRLDIKRRLRHRVTTVGSLQRVVSRGTGRMRLTGRVQGRRLHPGRYRLILRVAGCPAAKLLFTVSRH